MSSLVKGSQTPILSIVVARINSRASQFLIDQQVMISSIQTILLLLLYCTKLLSLRTIRCQETRSSKAKRLYYLNRRTLLAQRTLFRLQSTLYVLSKAQRKVQSIYEYLIRSLRNSLAQQPINYYLVTTAEKKDSSIETRLLSRRQSSLRSYLERRSTKSKSLGLR